MIERQTIVTVRTDQGIFFSWPFNDEETAMKELMNVIRGLASRKPNPYGLTSFSFSIGAGVWNVDVKE